MLIIIYAVCVPVALLIAALAVGIPYFRSHARMRHPHELGEAKAYLEAKATADDDVIPGQPPPPARQPAVATTPVGMPRSKRDRSEDRRRSSHA